MGCVASGGKKLDGMGGKSKGRFNLEKETRYPFFIRETDQKG